MASIIYNTFKTGILSKLVSCTSGGDTFNVSLYTSQPAVTVATYNTTGEVATAGGYTIGGIALTTPTLSGTGTVSWLAAPAVWTSSGTGFSASYCVIYDSTATNKMVCSFDFGGAQVASGGGTFTITWNNTNPGAILTLA